MHQRLRHAHALAEPVAELGVNLDPVRSCLAPAAVASGAAPPSDEGQVLAHRHLLVERWARPAESRSALALPWRVDDVVPVETRRRWAERAAENPQRGRLARAVEAQKAHDLAAVDAEREVRMTPCLAAYLESCSTWIIRGGALFPRLQPLWSRRYGTLPRVTREARGAPRVQARSGHPVASAAGAALRQAHLAEAEPEGLLESGQRNRNPAARATRGHRRAPPAPSGRGASGGPREVFGQLDAPGHGWNRRW